MFCKSDEEALNTFSIDPKEFTNNLAVCFPTNLIPNADNNLEGYDSIAALIASNKFIVFFSFH